MSFNKSSIFIGTIVIITIIMIASFLFTTCKLLISWALFWRHSCSWEPPSPISGDTFTLVLVGKNSVFCCFLDYFYLMKGSRRL